jgi:hypothetical protein
MIESESPIVEKLITFLYRRLVGDALLLDGDEQKVEGEIRSLGKTCAGKHLSAGLVVLAFSYRKLRVLHFAEVVIYLSPFH